MADFRIVPAGDGALLFELPARIDPETNRRVVALGQAIRDRCATAIRDVVVGYCSVTTYFDPLLLDAAWLEAEIRALADTAVAAAAVDGPVHEVPVCYGGEYGPDLADVAAFARGTAQDVVELHSAVLYRVYMIGFVPGLPYMASVDPRLALPRRTTPRTRVPAGSVAIAAGQTCIYPTETPGGWHLIGRTRVKPYEASRAEPFLFRAGDRVKFLEIDSNAFERGA